MQSPSRTFDYAGHIDRTINGRLIPHIRRITQSRHQIRRR